MRRSKISGLGWIIIAGLIVLILAVLGLCLGCKPEPEPATGGPEITLEAFRALRVDRKQPEHETIPDPLDSIKLTRKQVEDMADSARMRAARLANEAEELEVWLLRKAIRKMDSLGVEGG